MSVVVWIVLVLLVLIYLAMGGLLLGRTQRQLSLSMGWVEDLSPRLLKFMGAIELLAALALIFSAATGILTWLAPVAAVVLALVALGMLILHARRKETALIVWNLVLLVLALYVAYNRL